MNRRQFLAAPLLAVPALAVAALPPMPPSFILYPYSNIPDAFTQWVVSVGQGERVGLLTVYHPSGDCVEVFAGRANEMEWFTKSDDIRWAREFYPEAFVK